MSRIAWLNGQYLPLAEAKIPIQDRGFLFADGIYEVTAVIDGKLVDFDAHLARLLRSLGEIELALPVSGDELRQIHHGLIARNKLGEGLVYLQVTRGAAERDFAFPAQVQPTLALFTQAKALVDNPAAKTGIKVKSVPDQRWARCDIKSVALLAQVLAKQAAAKAGCQEAWMLHGDEVTEGASSTAFIITHAGELVTRPLSNAVLPGVTRIAIMKLIGETGLRLEERAFTLTEALNAAEAFNSSAGGFVMPVVEIDGRALGDGAPGKHTAMLRAFYVVAARAAS